MPFAVRRSDGKFLKKTTSRKEWVDDFDLATTWSGKGHASSAVKAMGAHAIAWGCDCDGHPGPEEKIDVVVEIVEVERRVRAVAKALRFHMGERRGHREIVADDVTPAPMKFRHVDE